MNSVRYRVLRSLAKCTALFVLLVGGCTGPETEICASGLACPTPQHCAARQDICISTACGNGTVDRDEVCDDGNIVDGDGCNAQCTSNEACGNSFIDSQLTPPEVCDDGNTVDNDGCSKDCRSQEGCGNGVVDLEKGEQCDDGNTQNVDDDGESPRCNFNCLLSRCGDGILNRAADEKCDDAGESPTCDPDCTPSACGDGYVNVSAGEVCDDRNTKDKDGCNSECTSSEECGNGLIDREVGEECDDGDPQNPKDSGESARCNNNCKLSRCGDGITNIESGEQCDDSGSPSTATRIAASPRVATRFETRRPVKSATTARRRRFATSIARCPHVVMAH